MQKLTFFVSDTSVDMVMLLPIWPAQIRDHGDAIVAVTILNIADAVLEIFNRAFRLSLKQMKTPTI